MAKSWIEAVEELSPAAMTVRAQAMSVTDMGRLYWSGFFPRQDVASVDLNDVTTLDDRPVADRREWNQRGRHVPPRVPARREASIVPIEAYDKIGERELQKLAERFNGNEQQMADVIGVSIPQRVERLAMADYRRLEVDAMTAWTLGTITQRNPQNAAETYVASFGFDAGRIQTASPVWDTTTAYTELLAWYEDGLETVGAGAGVALRLASLRAIQAAAPDLPNGVTMTRAQLVDRIQDDLGQPFQFFVIEDTVDLYPDGGTATTSTKVWPAEMLAFVPADMRVGYTAFAPVVRAMELARQIPAAGIDTRGVTVYYDEAGTGRELTVEAQLNALAVPDEQRVFTIDIGV
jgi:hypothetical protein